MNCEMINYKSTQNVQPVYDYYIETDLDSVDDQPVDYSKKYTDQDVDFPNERPRTIKQSSSDEVKVYCIEGTPLTISSASSFCDLREIGTNDDVEKYKRSRLPSSVTDVGSIESFEIKKKNCPESPGCQIGTTTPAEEKDDIKEGKNVSFRSSNEISKASSPLMFSRSSSIASLNSFEQHSFVDDRSSMSAFSALTSGLISPSDLPDSPGDIMSPALTDKDSSPKIDVTKINFNGECHDQFTKKDEILPEKSLDNVSDNPIPVHSHLAQAEYIPVGLFEPGTKNLQENEGLMEQLDISNDSLDADEVFDDGEFNKKVYLPSREDSGKNSAKSEDESDEEDDILRQECIKLGMTSDLKEKEPLINRIEEDYQLPSQKAPVSQVETRKENIVMVLDPEGKVENIIVKREIVSVKIIGVHGNAEKEKLQIDDDINSDNDSDDELLRNCINSGMPVDTSKNMEANVERFESRYSPLSTNYNREKEELQIDDDINSDNDSDDELLRNCINSGMPLDKSKNLEANLERFESRYSPLPTNYNHEKEKLKIDDDINSDNDSDDELLQNCINSGRPVDKSKNMETNLERFESRYSPLPTNYNHEKNVADPTIKSDEDSDSDDDLVKQAILQGLPTRSPERKMSQQPCKIIEYHDVPLKTNILPNVGHSPIKSDEDSDGDDDLVKQAIFQGLPTKSPKQKILQQPCKRLEYHDIPIKTNILPNAVQMRMAKECDKRLSVTPEELIKSRYNPHPMSYSSMNANYRMGPVKKIQPTTPENTYFSTPTRMKMSREPLSKDKSHSGVPMMPEYNTHPTSCCCVNANCRMGPVKNVPNTHENPYFPNAMKMQMSREPVSKERLHSGGPVMYEYNTHPTSSCYVNNDSRREMLKQLSNKKRGSSGMNSDYNNSHLVNCRPMNIRHDYGIQMEMPRDSDKKKRLDSRMPMNSGYNPHPVTYSSLNELRDRYPDGTSDDGDDDCKLLQNCIKSGMPSPKTTSDFQKRHSPQTGRTLHVPRKFHTPRRPSMQETSVELNKKKNHSRLPQNQPSAPVYSNTTWISSTSYIDVDSMRIYHTEDTPVLSPTASISDLSSLSFNESFLNNSRNSDFSSESDEDDELLRGVIRLGMPEAKRAVA